MQMYEYINNYISEISTPIIFELGGHWGEDTKRLITYTNQKKSILFCVEPDPRNLLEIKKQNLQNLNHRCQLNLIDGAISNKVGNTTLYLSDGIHQLSGNQMTGANSIRKPKEVLQRHSWIDFDLTIDVETYTIDYLCEKNHIERIDFIWSDIQGCEYDMIEGAKNMIDNIGLMLLEYSDVELYEGQKSLDEIFNLLGNDWELIVKTNCDVLVRNKKYEHRNK